MAHRNRKQKEAKEKQKQTGVFVSAKQDYEKAEAERRWVFHPC